MFSGISPEEIGGYIHSVLHTTRKYHFAEIQYPGKANILVSTVQCYTKCLNLHKTYILKIVCNMGIFPY